VPPIAITLIAAWHILNNSLRFQRWRPKWTKPFVQEPAELDEHPSKDDEYSQIWGFALTSLSILALAAQIVKLKFPGMRIHATLLLISWTLLSLFAALSGPKYCPASLFAHYIPALVTEVSPIDTWAFPPTLKDTTHLFAAIFTLASILILLAMPMQPASPQSGPVSRVGAAPKSSERSPEDKIRLWQFLTVSWVSPLLAVGNERQLQKEDVWLLGFEFQNGRLAWAFRELRGSVFRRLLKANGIDCCILVLTSFIQLFCGKYLPSLARPNK
jgi:hypothetical protein